MSTGYFIVVEGIDGSGKSTLVRALTDALAARRTREPTDGVHGTAIRAAFAAGQRLTPSEERALVESDRRDHLAMTILPGLERGETVISDRYWPATCAYQGTDHASVRRIARENQAFARDPDVILFLDLPPTLAIARIHARGEGVTAVETEDNLRACAARYEALWADAEVMRDITLVRLDARLPAAHLIEHALRAIHSGLDARDSVTPA